VKWPSEQVKVKAICHKNVVDLKIPGPSPFGDAFFFDAEAPVANRMTRIAHFQMEIRK